MNTNQQSENLTEYILRSLTKLRHKRYESYVVHRIINLLNDLSLKFVTQQYVRRSDGRIALTDLFFPQLNLHVEVDEGHHFNVEKLIYDEIDTDQPHYVLNAHKEDKIREADIISITGHQIYRINVYKQENNSPQTLSTIHQQIDDLLLIIKKRKAELESKNRFHPWNIDQEFNPQTYIDLGEICIQDNVLFKTAKDACNCFGRSYKGWQKASNLHPIESDTSIWFPKLFKNDDWINSITPDGLIITEKSTNPEMMAKKVLEWKNERSKRIIFAHVKDNLSAKTLYRFMGLFEVKSISEAEGRTWKRISEKVKTYPPKSNS